MRRKGALSPRVVGGDRLPSCYVPCSCDGVPQRRAGRRAGMVNVRKSTESSGVWSLILPNARPSMQGIFKHLFLS